MNREARDDESQVKAASAASPELTFRHARELLAMIESSSADEVMLEICGLTLHVVRRGPQRTSGPCGPENPAAPTTRDPVVPGPAEAPEPAVGPAPAGTGAGSGADHAGEGHTRVLAPTAGVFYRAPSPSEPPFAEPGDTVRAGQTIGIIEVMKLLTTIVAPVDGTLVAFIADNGAAVPFEHPLAVIDPAER